MLFKLKKGKFPLGRDSDLRQAIMDCMEDIEEKHLNIKKHFVQKYISFIIKHKNIRNVLGKPFSSTEKRHMQSFFSFRNI